MCSLYELLKKECDITAEVTIDEMENVAQLLGKLSQLKQQHAYALIFYNSVNYPSRKSKKGGYRFSMESFSIELLNILKHFVFLEKSND
jgi:hypothetical protein